MAVRPYGSCSTTHRRGLRSLSPGLLSQRSGSLLAVTGLTEASSLEGAIAGRSAHRPLGPQRRVTCSPRRRYPGEAPRCGWDPRCELSVVLASSTTKMLLCDRLSLGDGTSNETGAIPWERVGSLRAAREGHSAHPNKWELRTRLIRECHASPEDNPGGNGCLDLLLESLQVSGVGSIVPPAMGHVG